MREGREASGKLGGRSVVGGDRDGRGGIDWYYCRAFFEFDGFVVFGLF